MIIGSILFVMMAAGLLMAGLLGGSNAFYYASIVSSVVAAFALVAGVRQLTYRLSLDRRDGAGGPAGGDDTPSGPAA